MDLFSQSLLLGMSFLGSFITVSLGIGGGVLLLAVMASLVPPAALIPLHGTIQLGSNSLRAALMWRQVQWAPFAGFTGGTIVGVVLGGTMVVSLPPAIVQVCVGTFVIWSTLSRPPQWLTSLPSVTGAIASFLSMFFGATGVFVGNFVKALSLPRQEHVATHAVMMTLQHCLKVVAFGMLGFAYGPWIWFIAAMIGAGFLGTLVGRMALNRFSDNGFKRALDVVLILISLRLIWVGATSLIAG